MLLVPSCDIAPPAGVRKAWSKTLKSIGAFSIAPAEQGGKAGILDTVRPEKGSRRSLSIAQRSGRRDRLPTGEPFHFSLSRRRIPRSGFTTFSVQWQF
ncbi:hypothetical protein RMR21_024205 (plasmid) [Agrobacterium sp. rho-8.1]|nr:hypothetical protein [Agrobacterium sp. rho-8.1]